MSKKTDIKNCRYVGCLHGGKIDITTDVFEVVGKYQYYHSDCLKKKNEEEKANSKTKSDLQYIKNQWVLHIDNTVVYSQLFRCLNDLIARGISSEYLVFVFDYVVKNKMNLRHPFGFKYYVAKDEIKDAYKKEQAKKNKIDLSSFTVTDNTDAPTFTAPKKQQFGFGSILGGSK